MFTTNRASPHWVCRLLHRWAWFNNAGWTYGPVYQAACQLCGACWPVLACRPILDVQAHALLDAIS